ncbi:MAG: DUF1295 domain-containing protein [Myxococcaceae bacterium]
MNWTELARWAPWGVLACAVVVGPLLLKIPAPYGRYARAGWGPNIPARLGWTVMESVSFTVFPLSFFALSPFASDPRAQWLLVPWLLHYGQRSFVFPLMMKQPRPMPLATMVMAMVFNGLNALGNGAALAPRGPSPSVVLGVLVFAVGFALNLHADAELRGLRSTPGEYRIPRGGLYRWVSCPNYLGECLEWLGFAMAAGTLAAFAFFVFTMANLLPRAVTHHRWYRERFPDYPRERKVLVPFVL